MTAILALPTNRTRGRVLVRAIPDKLLAGADLYTRFAARSSELTASYTDHELTFLADHYRNMSTIYRELIARSPTV
jgi:hypothetical protein